MFTHTVSFRNKWKQLSLIKLVSDLGVTPPTPHPLPSSPHLGKGSFFTEGPPVSGRDTFFIPKGLLFTIVFLRHTDRDHMVTKHPESLVYLGARMQQQHHSAGYRNLSRDL